MNYIDAMHLASTTRIQDNDWAKQPQQIYLGIIIHLFVLQLQWDGPTYMYSIVYNIKNDQM